MAFRGPKRENLPNHWDWRRWPGAAMIIPAISIHPKPGADGDRQSAVAVPGECQHRRFPNASRPDEEVAKLRLAVKYWRRQRDGPSSTDGVNLDAGAHGASSIALQACRSHRGRYIRRPRRVVHARFEKLARRLNSCTSSRSTAAGSGLTRTIHAGLPDFEHLPRGKGRLTGMEPPRHPGPSGMLSATKQNPAVHAASMHHQDLSKALRLQFSLA